MRIAALQMVAVQGDVDANLSVIESAVVDAASRGADLLVAPELATTGYGAAEYFADLAHEPGHRALERLVALAKQTRVTVIAGFAERSGATVYNSALLARPEAEPIVYRKCHLYGPYERSHFGPGGEHPTIVEVAGLRLGMLICYDVEFPETVRQLALAGADLVAVPTALPELPHAEFIAGHVVPVRAFENQVAVIYANHAGSDAQFAYAGRSCIVMPDGTVAARAGAENAQLIMADYHPPDYAASREANPYLTDRRIDLR